MDRASVKIVRSDLQGYVYPPYVHTLLFSCERCQSPLAIPIMSQWRNLEEIDAETFEVECECGWRKKSLGIEATRHWVIEWEFKHAVANSDDRMAADQ
jgi:hypothetical protein